jgi:uncharacterized protein YkwD
MRCYLLAAVALACLSLQALPVAAVALTSSERALSLINRERTRHGCAPLKLDRRLTEAAERQSRDMATYHFFSHTNPKGGGPGQRVKATGYVYMMVGENIEVNSEEPEEAVDTWMNSPGHRANILTCAFRETGIAVYTQRDDHSVRGVPAQYRAYWTQVFALPMR